MNTPISTQRNTKQTKKQRMKNYPNTQVPKHPNLLTPLPVILGIWVLGYFSAFPATVTGLVYNVTGSPAAGIIRFEPQSTPWADSQTFVGGNIRVQPDTNGVFSVILKQGRYKVNFMSSANLIHILVPNDNNTYNLNDLSVDIPSTLGKISSRVLPGQGTTFETNAPGTFAEQLTVHVIATNQPNMTVTNGFRATNAIIKQLTVVGASSFIQQIGRAHV